MVIDGESADQETGLCHKVKVERLQTGNGLIMRNKLHGLLAFGAYPATQNQSEAALRLLLDSVTADHSTREHGRMGS